MSDDVEELVAVLRAAPHRTALLLDFDGTLAPVVNDPSRAVPLPGVADALIGLSAGFGVVAVISGRPITHLRAHLPPEPTLVGLYGLEQVRAGEVITHPEAAQWGRVIDDVAAAAEAELPSGVGVEHKGLSLTLHVREHPDLASVVAAWADAAAQRTGLLVRSARMSTELHPPVAVDKGTAVASLLRDVEVACFIGDDVGDLPAFDALDAFAARGGTAIRLVVQSAELDEGMRARADALLAGPPAVLDLLLALLA